MVRTDNLCGIRGRVPCRVVHDVAAKTKVVFWHLGKGPLPQHESSGCCSGKLK